MIAELSATGGSTMKALVQEGYGSADALRVKEVERPAVGPDQVLVRVRAASLNALDWHTVHGGRLMRTAATVMRQKDIPVRGVDLAGVVEAVGHDVTSFVPGDEVFGGAAGAIAQYAVARERGLVPKPRTVSFAEASTIGVAGRTALQGLRDHGQVRAGQRVLIWGAGGGVGTYAVQIARALGAHVTAVTGPGNLELVRGLGADEVFDYTRDDLTRRGQRYDVIYDVGANRALSYLRRLVTADGVIVLAGADKRGGLAIFARIGAAFLRARLLRHRIVFYVAKPSRDDLVALREMIAAGKVRPAIDRTYPLSEAVEAVRYLGTGRARAKVVITID